ncbi:MAG: diguanylate cyclase [Paenibacillaceae bacterium]|jgi:diguanylate cyclase (GGDEF)-like protein|nr:diguanylate cyclase [Paenibacillaceae bacterium]
MIQYRSVAEAAEYIINVLKNFISANTIFIALNDGANNTILKSYNRDEKLVPQGMTLPLLQTYCSIVFQGAESLVVIPDTSKDPLTVKMDITHKLGPCSFIGIPIATRNNPSYGTICAMDRQNIEISEKEVLLLESMAALISYVVDLEDASITDGLTGLYNRKYLEKIRLSNESERMNRHWSLLFIDIDDFKMINDTYGHDAGDLALLEVAKRLKQQMRKTDTIVRMGGDEFIIVIEGTQESEELRIVAEKVLASVQQPIEIAGNSIQLSVSVGVSSEEVEAVSLQQLIIKADQAMYEVKNHGKAGYKISL